MTLLEQVESLWTKKEEDLADKWAKQLMENRQKIDEAVKLFHKWSPLEVYLPVSRAMKKSVTFSIRYQGQEVAILKVNKEVRISISEKTAKNNSKHFNYKEEGEFQWRGERGAAFRDYFVKLGPEYKCRIHEHRIESDFLKQMSFGNKSKFEGTLSNIQPVMLAGCPFQFPLPISGNSGTPKAVRGNIDILARRGIGKGTKISIWELKKPGHPGKAIEQSYIYAVTLLKMLRSKSGKIWYQDIIGFKSDIPQRLSIEVVVSVSIEDKQKVKFLEKVLKFIENNELQIENDSIKFCIAYYMENPLTIDFQDKLG